MNNESKKKKIKLPSYWAIKLDGTAFEHDELKTFLNSRTDLKPLEKIHSTLLYAGNKHSELTNEINSIVPHIGHTCRLEIGGYGYSEDACALRVDSITLVDIGETMPSYPNQQQHVTIALKNGIKPFESVKTLIGENKTIIEFTEPMVLFGTVESFLY